MRKSFGPMMATVMRFAATNVTEGVVPDSRSLDHGGKSQGHRDPGPRLPGRQTMSRRSMVTTAALLLMALSWRRRRPGPLAAPDAPGDRQADRRRRHGRHVGRRRHPHDGAVWRSDQGGALHDRPAGPAQHAHRRPQPSRRPHRRGRLRRLALRPTDARPTRPWSRPSSPGSFYSEPAGVEHFAMTGPEGASVYISGYGPTSTDYVEPAKAPKP
ncbi:hypothetical protein ACRAWD_22935 [Caulobacter segnis]